VIARIRAAADPLQTLPLEPAEQLMPRRNCGGDIRLIAFITEPGPIRKILTHLGEPLEPPPQPLIPRKKRHRF